MPAPELLPGSGGCHFYFSSSFGRSVMQTDLHHAADP
jgi:hypothetical protein